MIQKLKDAIAKPEALARDPISDATWSLLTRANAVAERAGWAESGVFATGVGPDYVPDQRWSLLYVGKSAGPLGTAVGSNHDHAASARASANWMVERQNKRSPFWQFVEQIDPTRRRIAWTNICKMDRIGGEPPPSESQFAQVASPCMAALEEEIVALKPRVTVFASSGLYDAHIQKLLAHLGYQAYPLRFCDGWTSCACSSEGRFVILTRHPQGWLKPAKQRVIELLKMLLSGSSI